MVVKVIKFFQKFCQVAKVINFFQKFCQVAKAKRDFDVKKSQYDTEVNTAKAEAELAFQLQVIAFDKIVHCSPLCDKSTIFSYPISL